MHDRVVDRAAAYTTPGRLAIRDWLLITLSFTSGIYEAVSFLSFGKVFTGFQTGNIIFLGLGLDGTRPPLADTWPRLGEHQESVLKAWLSEPEA